MVGSHGIFWCNGSWAGRLALIARPRGGEWLFDDLLTYRTQGFDVIVSLLCDNESLELGLGEEGSLAIQHGLDFINFSIGDYDVPKSMLATFELSNDLRHRLSTGETVGIHCRQSVGRSSLIAACLFVLAGESPEVAFAEIQRARSVRVPDTIQQTEFVRAFADALTIGAIN